MTSIIVPLAGKDCYSTEFGIRPLFSINGISLISYVLKNRAWIKFFNSATDTLTFVIRNEEPYSLILYETLLREFPFCDVNQVSRPTLGSPLTALAGIATIASKDEPLIFDLADIYFDLSLNPVDYFKSNDCVSAIVPYFISNDINFSYLKISTENPLNIIGIREKLVISNKASAGTYIFKNLSTFIDCFNFGINNPEICNIHGSYFFSPLLNRLIKHKQIVHAIPVENCDPVSKIFHRL